jgi:quercetin dioxygenase-like cupin family protein
MNAKAVAVLKPTDAGPELAIIEGPGRAVARVWPGIGALHRSLHTLELRPDSRTHELSHPSEAVYYVVSGTPRVVDGAGKAHQLEEGSMVHIRPGHLYRFDAGDEPTTIIGGPCPPDPALYEAHPPMRQGAADDDEDGIRLFHRDKPGLKVPLISRDARFVVWLGAGAETANMNFVILEPGESNVPHHHPESEDTIFILSGRGSVQDLTNGTRIGFQAGDVVHVPVGIEHAVHADAGVAIISTGGPCPADRHLLAMLGYEGSG